MLATKNNRRVAFMLANRKEQESRQAESDLGHKILRSVTIFRCENANQPGFMTGCLIWELQDFGVMPYGEVSAREAEWQVENEELKPDDIFKLQG